VTGERILVVDDADDMRSYIVDCFLRPYAFTYQEACDGLEALQIIQREPPDLILLDYQLPQLDGIGLLRRMREEGINIPVVLMTMFGSEEIAAEVFRLGVRDYLIKPFEEAALFDAVERALAETRLRRERDDLTRRLEQSNFHLEQQLADLQLVHTLGRDIVRVTEYDDILCRTLDNAAQLIPARRLSLVLQVMPGARTLRRASRSDGPARPEYTPCSEELADQVLSTGEARVGSPLYNEDLEDFTVELAVPLQAGETRGVLLALVRADLLSSHAVDLLNVLAVYAASSLERERLAAFAR